jgi:DNA-binding HxlR family transcriptional regulator
VVNGSGNGARSGAQTLALLASPINSLILQALTDGPKAQAELKHAAGSPAQTTLRLHLRRLTDIGSIARHRRNRFPGVLEFELTEAGRELLAVAAALEYWLERAPRGGLRLGTNAAKAATKALAEGWSTTILRALAAGPLSLTELDQIIGSLSYPSLERRMAAMRLAGQVEAKSNTTKGTPYAVTRWLRQGVAPIAVATRWERRHLQAVAPPPTRIDTEAMFMLTAPLLALSSDVSGACRMAVEIPNGGNPTQAGVLINAKEGKVASCKTQLHGTTDGWASGSAAAWLGALVDADSDGLELGGDGWLARAFLQGLHEALFGAQRSDLSR